MWEIIAAEQSDRYASLSGTTWKVDVVFLDSKWYARSIFDGVVIKCESRELAAKVAYRMVYYENIWESV